MADSQPIVSLRGITKTFWRGKEAVTVLDGLSLDVPRGAFEALMGPSGSGKSTLLNLIAGLDRPTQGQVVVDGQVISALSESALARWRADTLGFVFQSFNLLPVLTAVQNVEIPLDLVAISPGQYTAQASSAYLYYTDEQKTWAAGTQITIDP